MGGALPYEILDFITHHNGKYCEVIKLLVKEFLYENKTSFLLKVATCWVYQLAVFEKVNNYWTGCMLPKNSNPKINSQEFNYRRNLIQHPVSFRLIVLSQKHDYERI